MNDFFGVLRGLEVFRGKTSDVTVDVIHILSVRFAFVHDLLEKGVLFFKKLLKRVDAVLAYVF